MKKNIFKFYFLLICFFAPFSTALANKKCSDQALNQAMKILIFHTNTGDEFIKEIDSSSIKYKTIKNPLNPKQIFQVIEIRGSMEKMEYRIQLTYFPVGGLCVLVGEEILQIANF
jgi:hypothetical protein